MIYGSVCSGIEAATVAWHPLGWTPSFFAEIDPFARAVLAHHWPEVPLHGDFTTIQAGQYRPIDVLVGGTPCQSFSIAGLRGGIADDRGNLALEYLRLAERLQPRFVVWENVPGVFSSLSHDAPDPCQPPDDLEEGSEWVGADEYDAVETHAFGCFLAGLADIGYGWAYRVLDAQYAGLAQRRERVFVVGCAGGWARPSEVLSLREGMRWHPPPRRQTRERITYDVASSIGASGRGVRTTRETRGQDPVIAVAFGGNNQSGPIDVATAVNAHGGPHGRLDFESETFVTHALRADGFDASEDGTGRGTPLVASFQQSSMTGVGTVGYDADTQVLRPIKPQHDHQMLQLGSAVRRLTPRECERLQGFPDDYTRIPFRGKPAADGPRYRALGNSMAVPVMRWIGKRIDEVAGRDR